MPVQKAKAPASALGAAIKTHAKDETVVRQDFGDLPNGMSGIARLVAARRQEFKSGDNKGQQHIYLEGRVVEPEKAVRTTRAWKGGKVVDVSSTEERVKGRIVNQMLPLCATGKEGTEQFKDINENVGIALNELRTLGYETAVLDECDPAEAENVLDSILQQMAADGPHFKFRTTDLKPSATRPGTPRVFVNWLGATELEGGTPSGPDTSAVEAEAPRAAPSKNGSKVAAPAPAPEPEEEAEDLDALAEAADANDGTDDCVAAGTRLMELALAAGCEEEAVSGAESWAQVVEWIRAGEEGGEAAEPEAEPWKPVKGNNVYYRAINKATGRKAKFQCEIVKVDSRKKTMDLQNLDNKRLAPYKDVAWDNEDLIIEE